MTSEVDFAKWLAEAPPGARIVYHVGNVARERKAWTDRDGVKHHPIAGLDKLAKAVSKAAESGAVAVAQKRIGADEWQYVAIRSSPAAVRIRAYSIGRRNILLPSIDTTPAKAPRRPLTKRQAFGTAHRERLIEEANP